MNNKKFFNIKLYKDALKQLTTFSIVALIIMAIISILIPISQYISYSSEYHVNSKIVYSALETNSFYIFYPLIIAPILALILFRFLNNRNSSDIYHSIPHSRLCIYVSYLAALFTIVFTLITFTTIISIIAYSLLSHTVTFSVTQIIVYSFNIFIACILVISTTALACSITGTLFANISFTIIILFLPRFFIYVFISLLSDSIPNIIGSAIPILSPRYNLLLSTFGTSFNSANYGNVLLDFAAPSIYTILLSIIIIMLGIICFKKRKSETAGNTTNSKLLQMFSTITIGFTISLIPIGIIYNYIIHKNIKITTDESYYYKETLETKEIFALAIIYMAALLVMFIYELIASKKLKTALKSLIYMPIVFILNVIFLGTLVFNFHHIIDNAPDAFDVSYVQFQAFDIYDTKYYHYYADDDAKPIFYQNYFNIRATNIEITNPEIVELLCDSNKEYLRLYDSYLNGGTYKYYNYTYSFGYIGDSDKDSLYYSDGLMLDVTFKDGILGSRRTVYLKAEKYNYLLSLLEDSAYADIYTTLPDFNDLVSYEVVYKNDPINLSKKEYKAIFDAIGEDIKDMSINDFISKLYENSPNRHTYFSFSCLVDGVYCEGRIPIDTSTTPKANKLLASTIINNN